MVELLVLTLYLVSLKLSVRWATFIYEYLQYEYCDLQDQQDGWLGFILGWAYDGAK